MRPEIARAQRRSTRLHLIPPLVVLIRRTDDARCIAPARCAPENDQLDRDRASSADINTTSPDAPADG
eukprot:scaffold67636_cov33-Phaeocystis_antarctica.AAC.1